MQPRKQFTFYKSFLDAIESQPTARAQLALYRAVCRYAIYGEMPVFHGREEGIFFTIQPNLDAARRKAESGKQGGRISKRKANSKQTLSKEENEFEYESENESEIETESEMENECKTGAAAMAAEQKRECVFKAYQDHCGKHLMPWELMTETRRKTVDSYFEKGYTLADFEKVFQKAGRSAFLAKQNHRGWQAGIDWLLEEKNFARVLEGAFDDSPIPKGASGSLGQAELEAIQRVLREG